MEGCGRTEYVFNTRTLSQLDDKAVRKMIMIYSNKAEIDKNITTHSLRHTFTSDLLRNSENIRIVQKELGYSDITTT